MKRYILENSKISRKIQHQTNIIGWDMGNTYILIEKNVEALEIIIYFFTIEQFLPPFVWIL